MTIAMLSALSLVCMDFAIAGSPAVAVAAVQASQEGVTENLEPEVPLTTVDPAFIEGGDEASAEQLPDQDLISQEEPAPEELVFAGESDDDVVARLQAYLQAIDTLTGTFIQVAPSGGVSTGKLYLRRPGLLRFEYDPPTPLLIVANGGLVYVRDEALETTDSYPVGKTPLKFLLTRKIDLDDDARVVGVDRGVDSVAVTFASSDDETQGELSVIVTAPEMALAQWVVRDIQNGITVVTLDNVVQGERIPNRLFRAPETGGTFLDD